MPITSKERKALLACIAVFVNEGCHSVHGTLDDPRFEYPYGDVEIDTLITLLYPDREEANELIKILNTL